MKKIKRFIRVDFEGGSHYQPAKDEFDGKDNKVRFKIDSKGVLLQVGSISHFYPAGSYSFVTWE